MTKLQLPVTQHLGDHSVAGSWRLYARPRGGAHLDLSEFRGAATTIGAFGFEDPFGPKQITLTFPEVSYFEKRGYGDLTWARKKTSFDLIWRGALPAAYPFGRWVGGGGGRTWVPAFSWEGYIEDFTHTEGQLTVLGKGAMYQVDNYDATPDHPYRPLPYEYAIARQFIGRPHLRVQHLRVEWPDWWTNTYTGADQWVNSHYKWAASAKNTPVYLIPQHIYPGDRWTGMLTRDTGNNEAALSSYIQKLLQAMYTEHGRWTLELMRGRVPYLIHRTMALNTDDATVILDLAHPEITVTNLNENASQSFDVLFGSGVSLAGVAWSGLEFSNDGMHAQHIPLVASRQAWPVKHNDWLDLHDMPREVYMQFPPGLDQLQAERVARAHYARFADPGVIADIDIGADVRMGDGSLLPWPLVRAGMKAELRGLWGLNPGPVGHITSNSSDLPGGKVSVTVDTKWRDALTANEAKLRGRDTLNISRMLVAGQYTPPVPDQILPWDYTKGSGVIPYHEDALRLFDQMPNDLRFPWESYTQAHPPSDARWRDAYVRVGPTNADFDKNWSGRPHNSKRKRRYAIPVRMAQKGSVALIQIGAYDESGNVLKVPFHVSFYYMYGTTVQAMPIVTQALIDATTPGPWDGHRTQHSPWIPDSWEPYNTDGTQKSTPLPALEPSAGLWKAWGNSAVKAGYFPGDGTGPELPTGLFVWEANESFDCEAYGQFNVYDRGQKNHFGGGVHAGQGMVYVMFYCDAQADAPVYFLGRMFRAEPGTTVGG